MIEATFPKCLQRKDQDILNALTKRFLQILRDSGWNIIKNLVVEFCKHRDIVVLTMNENWIAWG